MIEEREIAKLSKKFCEECKNRGFQCEVLKVYKKLGDDTKVSSLFLFFGNLVKNYP